MSDFDNIFHQIEKAITTSMEEGKSGVDIYLPADLDVDCDRFKEMIKDLEARSYSCVYDRGVMIVTW